jgi:hypothetical protein
MNMPAEHVFYIPVVLAMGMYIGWWWGRAALKREIAEDERERGR